MKALVLLFVLLVYTGTASARDYTIDLDLPPTARYNKVAENYSGVIKKLYFQLKSEANATLWATAANAFNTVAMTKYKEYAYELIGISRVLGISAAELYAFNCIYELYVMCTSIVARDKHNKPILERNLDFYYTPLLREAHVNYVYTRNNKEVARCGTFASFIGVSTCLKPGAFATSMNARKQRNLNEFLVRLLEGKALTTLLMRETVLKSANYDEAVNFATTAKTISGSYITIAGVKENEGTIITRGRDGADSSKKLSEETWYLAKCNVDDEVVDDARTKSVNERMAKLGQKNTSLRTVLSKVLLKEPLFNAWTVTTILMKPEKSYYNSIIADDPL